MEYILKYALCLKETKNLPGTEGDGVGTMGLTVGVLGVGVF